MSVKTEVPFFNYVDKNKRVMKGEDNVFIEVF